MDNSTIGQNQELTRRTIKSKSGSIWDEQFGEDEQLLLVYGVDVWGGLDVITKIGPSSVVHTTRSGASWTNTIVYYGLKVKV